MLEHHNLLKLFEMYESENSIYMVLELVTGGNLMKYIRKNEKNIELKKIQGIIMSLLKGIAHMHSY